MAGRLLKRNTSFFDGSREDRGCDPRGMLSLDFRVLRLPDRHRAHHVVILVIEDVTVPHVLAVEIELRDQPRDLTRIRDDSILRPRFPRFGRPRRPRRHVGMFRIERRAIDDTELRLMDVNRMRVRGEVADLPQFGPNARVLRHWIHPRPRIAGAVLVDGAEQTDRRSERYG